MYIHVHVYKSKIIGRCTCIVHPEELKVCTCIVHPEKLKVCLCAKRLLQTRKCMQVYERAH